MEKIANARTKYGTIRIMKYKDVDGVNFLKLSGTWDALKKMAEIFANDSVIVCILISEQ